MYSAGVRGGSWRIFQALFDGVNGFSIRIIVFKGEIIFARNFREMDYLYFFHKDDQKLNLEHSGVDLIEAILITKINFKVAAFSRWRAAGTRNGRIGPAIRARHCFEPRELAELPAVENWS